MSVPTVGPRDIPALVRAYAREDAVGVARVLRERHGHLVRVTVPSGPTAYLVTHPEDVERTLRSEPERFGYYTGGAASDFDRALGDTVVSLTEESGGWLERLRALAPEFRRASIEPKAPGLAAAAREAYAEHAGESVDALRLARIASLRMLGRWLFGEDVRRHEEEVVEAVTVLRGAFKRRNLTVRGAVAGALGIGGDEGDIEGAIDTLEGVAAALVERRVDSPDAYDDALATWLTRPDPVTGKPLAPATVEREAVGMVVAGFATLSAGLSWAIHALARRPELQARLAAEAERSALFGGDATGTTADQFPLADAVWNESLRLYPPLPLFGRRVKKPVRFRGHALEPGALALVSPYVTGRDPAFWSAPERFDPARFLRRTDRPEFAFYPFGGGRHACLGEAVATAEARVALAALCREYRLSSPVASARPEFSITLQPDRPLPVRLAPR